jgi:hypothetical protein
LCKEILPAQIDTLLTPGTYPMTEISPETEPPPSLPKYTNCGAFPGYIAKKLEGVGKAVTKGAMVRDPSDPKKFKYDARAETKINITMGITDVETIGKANGAWVPADGIKRPLPGDFYVLAVDDTEKAKFSHVGVIIDTSGERWITADAGQGTQDGPFNKETKKYAYKHGFSAGFRYRHYKNGWLKGEETQGAGMAFLKGWVNIDNPRLFPKWATPAPPVVKMP